ncbi:hypothetical protein [Comamonas aquatilis]|uniref:hypothetical protein n=1 Tax=Comamonas aquatilis TaxID=1778406 RepID=UPI0039EECC44
MQALACCHSDCKTWPKGSTRYRTVNNSFAVEIKKSGLHGGRQGYIWLASYYLNKRRCPGMIRAMLGAMQYPGLRNMGQDIADTQAWGGKKIKWMA